MKNKEDMEDEMSVEASEDCAQEETLEETEMEAADAEDDVFDFEASDIEENESFEEDEGLEEELSALGEGEGDNEAHAASEEGVSEEELQGTELQEFESAEIEALEEEAQEYLDPEQVVSILESMLFATDRPQTLASLKQPFKGTNIKTKDVKEALEHLTAEYASEKRGVTLEEVTGGYQLRTKVDNMKYLK